MLLLLKFSNLLIITSINIKINKDKIKTVPTYEISEYKEIKVKPIVIKYEAIPENKSIKNIIEITGFLLIITIIPQKNQKYWQKI